MYEVGKSWIPDTSFNMNDIKTVQIERLLDATFFLPFYSQF